MKKYVSVVLLAMTVLVFSCEKDDTATHTGSIEGNYIFKYLTSQTSSTLTDDEGGKAVSLANYTTTDNKGTVVIDANKITTTGFTYSVNATSSNYFYQDNQLVDSVNFPLIITIPPISSAVSYKLLGSDSIFVADGLVPAGGVGGVTNSGGSGGRYKLEGNVLTITQHFSKDSVFTDTGIQYRLQESALSSIVMEKQ